MLVPAAALVAAGCFYLFAPVNRLQNHLSQTLATVEIFTPELAELRMGTSIVFPRGGNLTVQAPNNIYAVPTDYYGNNTMPVTVCRDEGSTGIEFKDIEFSSLRKIYAYGLQRNFGSIEGELYLKDKRVVGDLNNKTGLSLRDCRLVLGGRVVKIGGLPAGGTVHIDETLDTWNGFPNQEMLFTELGIGVRGNRPGEPFFLERQMLSGLVQGNEGYLYGVQFLGWHDGTPDILEINGNSVQKDDRGMILVKQNINMELAEGKFRLPAGIIKPHSVINSQQPIQYREEKVMHGRTANLSYYISDAELGPDFTVEALELQKARGQFFCSVEIYNIQQDKWELFTGTLKRIAGDDLDLYMQDGKIMVRLTQTGEMFDFQQVWPGLAVEGVVSHD
ncbi:MAG: putative membrane protein [Pelotomaculum thermopropionicum]|uniref:Putative membrane protein n=1 Tax=Pelotomaculum thermopropionicum TaxID=110500 RepID=A0A101HTE9_9FIRM|nr:MAG: putative membrane protein [Pelotomaculum thermopropionicum]